MYNLNGHNRHDGCINGVTQEATAARNILTGHILPHLKNTPSTLVLDDNSTINCCTETLQRWQAPEEHSYRCVSAQASSSLLLCSCRNVAEPLLIPPCPQHCQLSPTFSSSLPSALIAHSPTFLKLRSSRLSHPLTSLLSLISPAFALSLSLFCVKDSPLRSSRERDRGKLCGCALCRVGDTIRRVLVAKRDVMVRHAEANGN